MFKKTYSMLSLAFILLTPSFLVDAVSLYNHATLSESSRNALIERLEPVIGNSDITSDGKQVHKDIDWHMSLKYIDQGFSMKLVNEMERVISGEIIDGIAWENDAFTIKYTRNPKTKKPINKPQQEEKRNNYEKLTNYKDAILFPKVEHNQSLLFKTKFKVSDIKVLQKKSRLNVYHLILLLKPIVNDDDLVKTILQDEPHISLVKYKISEDLTKDQIENDIDRLTDSLTKLSFKDIDLYFEDIHLFDNCRKLLFKASPYNCIAVS